jgi:hypothetical protein
MGMSIKGPSLTTCAAFPLVIAEADVDADDIFGTLFFFVLSRPVFFENLSVCGIFTRGVFDVSETEDSPSSPANFSASTSRDAVRFGRRSGLPGGTCSFAEEAC